MNDLYERQKYHRWELITTSKEMTKEVKKSLSTGSYDERYALKLINELEKEIKKLKNRRKNDERTNKIRW